VKIGLILIGGSLKGIYGHTGVVKAVRELGIAPDVILGASAGSVVAAFMAIGLTDQMMYHKMKTLKANEFLDPYSRWWLLKSLVVDRAKTLHGFVKGDKLEEYIANSLAEKDDFSKTTVPLYVAATNLKTYDIHLFNTGKISEKVRASTAVPMLFTPKLMSGEYYVDGAVCKEKLPGCLLEVAPDLDMIIVSNFSFEHQTSDNSYLDGSQLPIMEIMRGAMAMQESHHFPTRIGKTRVVHLKPGVRTPVDIFHPTREVAVSVHDESHRYAKYHLGRFLKELKKKNQPKPPANA